MTKRNTFNLFGRKSATFLFVFVSTLILTIPFLVSAEICPAGVCVTPDTLGDTTVEEIGNSFDQGLRVSLADLVFDANITVTGSQKQYQTWHTYKGSTQVEVEFVKGITAGGDVFGYYSKGQPATFNPLFIVGIQNNPLYPNIATATPGQKYTFTVPTGDISFAVNSQTDISRFWGGENSLNILGEDHMISYDVASTSGQKDISYVLGFEDIPFSIGDKDYNDVAVKVTFKDYIIINTPPTIALIGSTPISITVGQTYTDSGATASDLEDGNITSSIISSNTVNTSIVGEYSILYSVTDSGGLSATTSRKVNVVPVVNTYCPNGGYMSYEKFVEAQNAGLIGFDLGATSTPSHLANLYISNKTGCNMPITFESYKVFGGKTVPQEFLDRSEIMATSTSVLQVKLADCMSQVDWFYGTRSMQSDSDPATRFVFLMGFLTNASQTPIVFGGWDSLPPGGYCPVPPPVNQYCPEGGNMSYEKFVEAQNAGLISFDLSATNTPSNTGILKISNQTGCTAPISFSSYKVFNDVAENYLRLSSQQFIDSTTVNATSSSVLKVRLADCMSQMDYWYGPAPLSFSSTTPNWPDTRWPDESKLIRGVLVNATVNPNVLGGWDNLPPGGFCPVPPPVNQCVINVVSDTSNQVVGGSFAVATYSQNPRWTASIPGATWIWKTFFVTDPTQEESQTFTKTFDINSISTIDSASLVVAADNSYTVSVNGSQVGVDTTEFNYFDGDKDVYNVASYLHNGSNTISFTVKNWAVVNSTAQENPAGLLYKLTINNTNDVNCNIQQNTPPVITLIGLNPASVTVGQTYTDPGATALDAEDGNITANIIASSTVNTSVVGSYTITYDVKDSKGQAAVTVTRTVNVIPVVQPSKGKITFCLMTANNQNVIATTSSELPQGVFTINLATSTNFASSTIQTNVWNANTFSPDRKLILGINDSDCVTYDNLDLGNYYYSEVSINGPLWNVSKYNDQDTQPVNNVFDFFQYSTTSPNSDGLITLLSGQADRTIVIYNTFNPAPAVDQIPVITLVGNNPDSITVGQTYTDPGATALDAEDGNITANIIASSTVNTSVVGSYTITYDVKDSKGQAAVTVTRTVNVTAAPCTSNCGGGGGGGGGNGPIVGSLTVGGGNGPIVQATVPPVVLGESTNSCYYLHDHLRRDFNNDPVEVKKLQIFLRDLEGFSNLQITGVYDEATIAATNAFQVRYGGDVLIPWGYDGTEGTDYTYITTKKKVNEIYCKTAFPVTAQEQEEINASYAFFQSLRNEGIDISVGGTAPANTEPVINGDSEVLRDIVGQTEPTSSEFTTLAGVSTTTKSLTSGLTANVISAGKGLMALLFGILAWPFAAKGITANVCAPSFSGWLNIILVIIILIILYMWYREYRNNTKIEEINKEIDLK